MLLEVNNYCWTHQHAFYPHEKLKLQKKTYANNINDTLDVIKKGLLTMGLPRLFFFFFFFFFLVKIFFKNFKKHKS